MNHKNRLFLFTSVLVLGTLLIAGTVGYKMGSSSLEQSTRERLVQIREFKSDEIQKEFAYLKNALVLTSEYTPILQFLRRYPQEHQQLQTWLRSHGKPTAWRNEMEERNPSQVSDYPRILEQFTALPLFLQYQFQESARTQNRPLPQLASVSGFSGLDYFRSYESLHSKLFDVLERSHLSDVLLIEPNGTVAYSAAKSLALGDNLISGPLSNSRLAQAYRWSLNAPKGATKYFDFTPISHFWHTPAAFLTMPLFDQTNFVGTLVFQLSLDRIDQILSHNRKWKELGLGMTGEVVAFGTDGFVRNNPRMYLESPDSFAQKVRQQDDARTALESIERSRSASLSLILPPTQVRRYMERGVAFDSGEDYLGTRSLQSAGRVNVADNTDWIIISKMDLNESLAPLSYKLPWFFIGGFLLWSLALAGAWLVYRRMFFPSQVLADGMDKLKSHNFSEVLPAPEEDEYKDLYQKFDEVREDFRKTKAARDFLENVVYSLNEVFFIVEVEDVEDSLRKNFRVRGFNPTAQSLTGAAGHTLKNSDLSLWLETDYSVIENSLRERDIHKSTHTAEASLKKITGDRVPLEVSWARVNTENKGKILLAMMGTDMRWKKEIEKELKLKEELLKESQSLSRTGSFRWDIRTGKCLWSEEEFHLLGLTPDNVVPSYDLFRSLILSEDLPVFDKALAEAHKNIAPFHVDLRMKKQDSNDLIWVRCQGRTEYDDYGNALFMYVTTQDITELRRVEQSLITTKNEALKASQAKSEFLAQMSHEIRTPMNAIMGMAELLKETKLDADQKYYVTIFCKAGEVLMSLINDILDLSKIEAGEVSIENIPFEMTKLIADVEDMMKPRALEKGLSCMCEIAPGVSPHLMGDPTKLRQVLINLIGNSIKFTHKGQVRLVIGKNPSKKDTLLISVTDTGIGIPEDRQHMIFQKFSQADNSVTRKYGGTGLGLAISKSLVELMGGQIWFKSRPGTGTTFFFTIPYREQIYNPVNHKPVPMRTPELDFVSPKQRDPNHKVKILIADDTEDNRTLFTHYLKNEPFEIIEAENGLQAIDQIKSGEFDIVFMDVQMPEMDGYAATDRIREWEKESHKAPVPIIALTAHALAEDRQKSLRAGCNDHIAKPFKKDTLLGVINKYSL
ncbi:ATP-binding protein [Bdellovibrio bacteriovorus]|uniref:ATP-binding protein n=1 Tax=Bdellovibrio bacteriovorus TaxID=959 RepID=UPI003AA96D7B